MPELPEVEVTRLSFAQAIAGARVESVRVGKPLRWPLGAPAARLVGQQVHGVRRRGKYLLLDLDRGILLVHLGMSGSLSFSRQPGAPGAHDHFDLFTSHGLLRLNDPRRFGAVVYVTGETSPQAMRLLGKLGLEPLSPDFTVQALYAGLRRRNAAVKQVLLGGQVVVGLGNIYACEALFLAGIRPTLKSARVTLRQAARLHESARDVLTRAVQQGGSTLRDFSNALGEGGHFQLEAMVYGRAGLPCKVCSAPVRLARQGQRSTYWCARCQKT
ncbi:MAG: bifunctional DNA-formamidopyrimidine glycosylase/DNA-(apurinic or apyrimidinic site) lyase [Betaproteobacteria bacterium]